MKTTFTWFRIGWPREVPPEQLTDVMRVLATSGGRPSVIEAVGSDGLVRHQIGIPTNRANTLSWQLGSALPGIAVSSEPRLEADLDRAITLKLSTSRRPLRPNDDDSLSRNLLAALSATGIDETVILQWVLGRGLHPEAVPSQLNQQTHDTWYGEILALPFGIKKADGEQRKALAAKRSELGWQAVGRIAVRAETDARRYLLVRGVLSALRLAEAPGVRFLADRTRPDRVNRISRPLRWPLRLNVSELALLSSWPQGLTANLPVERIASRPVPPSRLLARRGRVIGDASHPGSGRPVAISVMDSLRHLHAIGPTGTGKSTLLLNLIVQDMEQGRSVVVVESKGDLLDEILARVPDERLSDVVLLDPSDREFPVGLNPLAPMGRPPELVADQLLSVFHKIYASHWGPRTQDILGAALLTLAHAPNSTLVALPLLLTDPGFRRRTLKHISDPVALEPFWAGYEAWSDNERNLAIAPVMNKLRPFLMRPQLRSMLGQSQPKFDVREVFTGRKIVLVNLSKGLLGSETAALLGGLVISQLWQATLSRSAIDPARRHPVFVTIDEFQDYLVLPTDLGDALGQARGLGVGFALAHQHFGQLDGNTKAAVLSNARNRVAFQLGQDDARALAAGQSLLDAEDFSSLGAFECYVQLVAGGAVQPWSSARTLPPPEARSDPRAVRNLSRQRYGTPRADVDAEVEQLVAGPRSHHDDLTPRPRRNSPGDRP